MGQSLKGLESRQNIRNTALNERVRQPIKAIYYSDLEKSKIYKTFLLTLSVDSGDHKEKTYNGTGKI